MSLFFFLATDDSVSVDNAASATAASAPHVTQNHVLHVANAASATRTAIVPTAQQLFGGEQRLRRFIEAQNRIAINQAIAATVCVLEVM